MAARANCAELRVGVRVAGDDFAASARQQFQKGDTRVALKWLWHVILGGGGALVHLMCHHV